MYETSACGTSVTSTNVNLSLRNVLVNIGPIRSYFYKNEHTAVHFSDILFKDPNKWNFNYGKAKAIWYWTII